MSQKEAQDSPQVQFNGNIILNQHGSYIEFSDTTKQYTANQGGGGGGTNEFPGGIIIGPPDDFYAIGYQAAPQTCVITSDSVDVQRLATDALASNETVSIKVENNIDMQTSVLITNTLASNEDAITVNTSFQVNGDITCDQDITAANIKATKIQCVDLVVSGTITSPTQPAIGTNNLVLRSTTPSVNSWSFNLDVLNNSIIDGGNPTYTPSSYNYTFAVVPVLDPEEVVGCYSTQLIFDQSVSDEEFDTTAVKWGTDGSISAAETKLFNGIVYSSGICSAGSAVIETTDGTNILQNNFLFFSFVATASGLEQPTLISAVKGLRYDQGGNIIKNGYQILVFTLLQDLPSAQFAYIYFSPTSYLLGL